MLCINTDRFIEHVILPRRNHSTVNGDGSFIPRSLKPHEQELEEDSSGEEIEELGNKLSTIEV